MTLIKEEVNTPMSAPEITVVLKLLDPILISDLSREDAKDLVSARSNLQATLNLMVKEEVLYQCEECLEICEVDPIEIHSVGGSTWADKSVCCKGDIHRVTKR